MTGAQSIREWIAIQGLPALRAQAQTFSRDYAAQDKNLANGQGPSEAFCIAYAPDLKPMVDLHEMLVSRDKDVDDGILKAPRLRTKFEEVEHSRIANLQESLLLLCQLQEMESAVKGMKNSMEQMQRILKP